MTRRLVVRIVVPRLRLPPVTAHRSLMPTRERMFNLGRSELARSYFRHEWTPAIRWPAEEMDRTVYNATSCAACHKQGGVGGAGRSRTMS